ncbi:hypothetical protein M885DRAFT_609085, partial [Pelagophyceae sp. CCMP2097]
MKLSDASVPVSDCIDCDWIAAGGERYDHQLGDFILLLERERTHRVVLLLLVEELLLLVVTRPLDNVSLPLDNDELRVGSVDLREGRAQRCGVGLVDGSSERRGRARALAERLLHDAASLHVHDVDARALEEPRVLSGQRRVLGGQRRVLSGQCRVLSGQRHVLRPLRRVAHPLRLQGGRDCRQLRAHVCARGDERQKCTGVASVRHH